MVERQRRLGGANLQHATKEVSMYIGIGTALLIIIVLLILL